MTGFRTLATILLCVPAWTAAFGWWDGGHMQVVIVGCSQMQPEAVIELAGLLAAHPYYERDFEHRMPDDVRAGTPLDRATWLLAHASTWPDIVRDDRHPGHRKLSRSTWHYVNLPIYLDPSDAVAFEGRLPANTSMNADATDPVERLNIVQALKRATASFNNAQVSKHQLAVNLCWILHLVGDIHQPMHATALFSEGLLPNGDRGGNLIRVSGRGTTNLHRLWDSAPGAADDYTAVLETVQVYMEDAELASISVDAANELNVERWAAESHKIAQRAAYTPILMALLRAERTRSDPYGPYEMDKQYFERVDRIARVRTVEAGYRLAALLTTLANSND